MPHDNSGDHGCSRKGAECFMHYCCDDQENECKGRRTARRLNHHPADTTKRPRSGNRSPLIDQTPCEILRRSENQSIKTSILRTMKTHGRHLATLGVTNDKMSRYSLFYSTRHNPTVYERPHISLVALFAIFRASHHVTCTPSSTSTGRRS